MPGGMRGTIGGPSAAPAAARLQRPAQFRLTSGFCVSGAFAPLGSGAFGQLQPNGWLRCTGAGVPSESVNRSLRQTAATREAPAAVWRQACALYSYSEPISNDVCWAATALTVVGRFSIGCARETEGITLLSPRFQTCSSCLPKEPLYQQDALQHHNQC